MMEQEPFYEDTDVVHIPHDPTPTVDELALRAVVDELYRRFEWWGK
jgi:hypothetical protein